MVPLVGKLDPREEVRPLTLQVCVGYRGQVAKPPPMQPYETAAEWRRRTKIREAQVARGRRVRQRLLDLIRELSKDGELCQWTNVQFGQRLNISPRQVVTHLKILREAGVIECKTKKFKLPGGVGPPMKDGKPGQISAVRTITVVDSLGHGNRVPEGQVRLEADASPRGTAARDHPPDPPDLQ